MIIIPQILDRDFHLARNESSAIPLIVEIPARKNFLPAIVSNSIGKFLVTRRLTNENRIRVGVFDHNPNKIDDVLSDLMTTARDLSIQEKYGNIFFGPKCIKQACDYIAKMSGMNKQPHCCLVPAQWSQHQYRNFFGKKVDSVYNGFCKIYQVNVPCPILCSRPDFVGMYTQFNMNKSSILIHNVKSGLAFCVDTIN